MHLHGLIVAIALTAQASVIHSSAEPQGGDPGSEPTTDPALAKLLVGIWKWPLPGGGSDTRIELRTDGSYEWWVPYAQSDLSARTVIQSGAWSVHERTLHLRVLKTPIPTDKGPFWNLPAGTELTYAIRSVSPEKVLLVPPAEKSEIDWARVSPQDEPFWKGALSYEPPFKMSSHLHPADAGTAVGDWELFSTGMGAGSNGPAKVVFHLGTVAEFIGTDRPAKPLETVADLKAFMDSELKASPPGSKPLISRVNIGGREALMSIAPTNQVPGEPIKWRGSVCFFWQLKPLWQNGTICSITMAAETRETFNLLTNSLKTVKVPGRR
jgi:hypothetical protein